MNDTFSLQKISNQSSALLQVYFFSKLTLYFTIIIGRIWTRFKCFLQKNVQNADIKFNIFTILCNKAQTKFSFSQIKGNSEKKNRFLLKYL